MHRLIVLLFALLFLSGCAATSVSVTRVGSETFPPLPEAIDVLVFAHDGEILSAYTSLGIVHHNAEGVMTPFTLDDVIEAIKSKAREIGANGLIIDQMTPMGAYGRGLLVRARAVRIPEKLR